MEQKAAHTPGPWVAQKDGYAVLSEDWLIGTPGGKPDEVAVCSKRDAALIAAAPTMYEYIASSASNGCASALKILEAIHAGA